MDIFENKLATMGTNRDIFLKHMGLPSAQPLAIEIDKAKGIFLFDKKGKRYIDMVSGVAVSNVGHLHPEVVNAVKKQLDKHMHLMVYGEIIQSPQTRLAGLLTQNLPDDLDSVYFVNSGSEAIEGAIKLAKRYTQRTEIVSFKDAYHGGTHGALSILGNEQLKYAFRPLLPDVRQIRFNDENDLNKITEKTACVVAETIQAEAGIILPQAGFLKELRKRCTETGTLLIIDDIQMGFGRTGKLFSFENYRIEPDILALAKAMGGGMPIGAFISSGKIMKSLTFNPELGHITTFGGHPVSCAAAFANLKVILDQQLSEDADKKGRRFEEELASLPLIKSIRRKGLMLGLDVESPDKAASLLSEFANNGLISDRFLFRPNAFRIAPPLTISESEIDLILDLIQKSASNI